MHSKLPSSRCVTLPKRHKMPLAKRSRCRLIILKSFHNVHPRGPHPGPLAKDVHGNRHQAKDKLDDAEPDVDVPRAIVGKPLRNEQTKNQAMKDIFRKVERH